MVARNGNGKAVTPEEIIMAEKQKEIIETEKEHLGDIEKQTGIYAPDIEKVKKEMEKSIVIEVEPITIYDELNRIQKYLRAPKNQVNKFGGYKYRNLEDILEAFKIVQGDTSIVISDEIVNIGDRFYVKATATLYYKGESISNTAYAREALTKKGMDDSQLTGATSSYARKYALNGLFSIDDSKDADFMDNTQNNTTSKKDEDELLKKFEELYGACETLEDLKKAWEHTPSNLQAKVKHLKDKRKTELDKKQ
jgi:hypothetical protein